MRTITLTRGYSALVDAEDYESLNCYKWRALVGSGRTVYAIRTTSRRDGPRRTIGMHRQILGMISHVDHEDHNGLNNQRLNLRPASKSKNAQNVEKYKGTSRFKGASWSTRNKRWICNIKCGPIVKSMSFKREENAAQAYNLLAAELFGEFASFNQATG